MRMGADPNASSPHGTALKMAKTAPTKNLLRGLPSTPSTRRLLTSSTSSTSSHGSPSSSNNRHSKSVGGTSVIIDASGESQIHYQAELDNSDNSDGEYDGDDENSSTEDGSCWREAFTEIGQRYYFNVVTGEAMWDKPAKHSPKQQQQKAKGNQSVTNNSAGSSEDSGSVWVECFTADGTKFFHNPTTNQSVWELPEDT